jgi:RNA polymerase sigma-70 factor (ECF subfamily)
MTLLMSSRSDAQDSDQLGSPDTAELVGSVAGGDEEAFSELYRRSSGVVYGVALRVTRDSVLAQDVLQETFLQAWREAGRFDPARGSARAWLLTIAHRRAVDRVRHEQRTGIRETAWGLRAIDTEHDSVAEIVELRAEHRLVRTALDSLTTLQRQAIELAYVQGLTHTEVAAELGIPLGTAKTRLRDGLMRLRESIGATT